MLDVVFVHGLDGDPRNTWQSSGADDSFWPRWLSEDLPSIAVWSLGYEVTASLWKSHTMPLVDRAANALALLEANEFGDVPIAFVVHSMGGLLVKQMLRSGMDLGQPAWDGIARQTVGIAFISTPHAGAQLASWMKHATLLRPSVSLDELSAHGPQLRDLNSWYRNRSQGIKTLVFCEKKPTMGVVVVDESSADPGIVGAVPIPLDEDHLSIVKPKSRKALLYSQVRLFIKKLATKGVTPSGSSGGGGSDGDGGDQQNGASDIAKSLDDLENATKLLEGRQRAGATEQEMIDRTATFVSAGRSVLQHLHNRLETQPSQIFPVALSTRQMASVVDGCLKEWKGIEDPASRKGCRARVRTAVYGPATKLALLLEERTMTRLDDAFFGIEDAVQEPGAPIEEILEGFRSDSELVRLDAAIAAITQRLDETLSAMERSDGPEKRLIADGVWEFADAALMEARTSFWKFARTAESTTRGEDTRWHDLCGAFSKEPEFLEVDALAKRLQLQAPNNLKVLARCLLLHPSARHRLKALDLLDLPDLWQVSTHPATPISWRLTILRHIKKEAPAGYLKIFFVCVSEDLLRETQPTGRASSEWIVPAVDIVKEFFELNCLHETTLFEALAHLEQQIRNAAKRVGLLVDLDPDYRDRVAQFFKERKVGDQPVGDWHLVPLPIQRRIARLGHYLKYFICHPIDPIALETLPHVERAENIAEYIATVSINSRVLVDLSKNRALFQIERARFALVANPKTPPSVIASHLAYLRADLLRKLASSKDCNPYASQRAKEMLKSRS